jgi:hypothetical protein
MDYTIIALMFPAIPIMLIVYGNRFARVSGLIRKLHDKHEFKKPISGHFEKELETLKKRVALMRGAQLLAGIGFLLNMVTMFALYLENQFLARVIFGLCMIFMILSIFLYMREVQISARALEIHLSDLDLGK